MKILTFLKSLITPIDPKQTTLPVWRVEKNKPPSFTKDMLCNNAFERCISVGAPTVEYEVVSVSPTPGVRVERPRVKKSDILKTVKRLSNNIAYDPYDFLKLTQTIDKSPERNELIIWVSGLLGGCYSYAHWMQKNYPALWSSRLLLVDLPANRARWLDWMITYWEEQENETGMQVDGPQTR